MISRIVNRTAKVTAVIRRLMPSSFISRFRFQIEDKATWSPSRSATPGGRQTKFRDSPTFSMLTTGFRSPMSQVCPGSMPCASKSRMVDGKASVTSASRSSSPRKASTISGGSPSKTTRSRKPVGGVYQGSAWFSPPRAFFLGGSVNRGNASPPSRRTFRPAIGLRDGRLG